MTTSGSASRGASRETSIHRKATSLRQPALDRDGGRRPAATPGSVTERQIVQAWERFVVGEQLSAALVSEPLLSSWQRSKRSGVEPGSRLAPLIAHGDRLEQMRRGNGELLRAAQGLFKASAHLLASSGSIMLLTDASGVVLEAIGDMRTLNAAEGIHLVAGGHWNEEVIGTNGIGTNGIGTALAMRGPVQVHAAEHFCEGIKSWTCSAAPVFQPGTDRILGVVDISGPPSTYQLNNLALAVAAARQIEAVLAERVSRERFQLLEAGLSLGSRLDWVAMLALDRHAQVIYASGDLTESGLRVGSRLAGLDTDCQVGEWARQLPAGLQPEWLHPVSANGQTIGALLAVPPRAGRAVTVHPVAARPPVVSRAAPGSGVDLDPSREDFETLVGRSPALQDAIARARKLSSRRVSVLIQGETGVGKELFARTIHGSEARSGLFVAFSCGATTKELIGSELFGHVRGAYTGATQEGRPGRFELAHGGTLCLDEIGELPLDLQPVLLRALEEGIAYRLGDSKPRRFDVRLLAMTNRDLQAEVEAGRFRRDLYHRISVTRIRVPPLREREFDIDRLTEHFNRCLSARHGVPRRRFGSDILALLRGYGWPGNVRELRNVVEGLLLTSDELQVSCGELPEEIRAASANRLPEGCAELRASSLEESERQAIVRAVQDVQGNLAQAARALGISRSTLYRKLERYQLEGILRVGDESDPVDGSPFIA